MRPIAIVVLVLLASAGLDAQGVQVVDLGGGIYQAVGAGIQGSSGVRVPQSNTFLIATSAGNVIVDTSIAAAARAHAQGCADGRQGRIDPGDHPHPRARYTLRGTRPRWALDYVDSLNKVLALDPEMVLPSHGPATNSNERGWLAAGIRDAESRLK